MEINMNNAELIATDFCDEIIRTLHGLRFSIYVGGSIALNKHDKFSDIDICIIHDGDISIADIPNAERIVKTPQGIQSSVNFKGEKIDLRLDCLKTLTNSVEDFISRNDLTPRGQLYLSALKAGRYCKDDLNVKGLTRNLSIDEEARSKVIADNCRFIRDYGFLIYLERGDYATLADTLLFTYRAFIHVYYALDFSLFRGYKHAAAFETNKNKGGQAVIEAFQSIFMQPEAGKLKTLSRHLNSFFQLHLPQLEMNFDFQIGR
ncbi:DNA polymerase, beta-like region [Pseudomonas syringae pv. syringae B728a]|uniref:DNA polymerase, beta-like region n=3 Tax=Pseudomonas TaxID=286 RepID=Q4ZWG3_PSEU2|nr:DNA polymerase, beta-like region [Pseudomonas syringae pv. syringae B728a]PYD17603.1 hypothetical protein DND47_08420 [Pseudomonas syringae pv. syringae]